MTDFIPESTNDAPAARSNAGAPNVGKGDALAFGRAYFERGFIAAYAWAATKLPSAQLSDAVIDHAWDHRDEGLDCDDLLPTAFAVEGAR